jgi:hypothetical protein
LTRKKTEPAAKLLPPINHAVPTPITRSQPSVPTWATRRSERRGSACRAPWRCGTAPPRTARTTFEASAVDRAHQAFTARESARSAAIEAERLDTVSDQLEARRRLEVARRAQDDMDELALRRRSGRAAYREL